MKFVAAKTFAGPDFKMARSALGVTVVITGGFVLLSKFVSTVGDVTIATFVSEPLAGAVTVKVKFVEEFTFNAPKFQLTMPLLLMPPPDTPAKMAPAGTASVTTTALAIEGPALLTVIV